MKAWGRNGMKINTNELGHITYMAAMPIYGKNLKKSSPPEPIDRWPWNLVCSIVYASTTKIVQIMTLGCTWPILRQGQIWSHRLLYGKNWNLLIFFWNYCSLRSQAAWSIQLNKFMKLGECQRSRPFFDLGQRSLRFQSENLFFAETVRPFGTKAHIKKFKGEWEWKFIQMSLVTWPTWPPCQYMVKTLKNLLLQKQ